MYLRNIATFKIISVLLLFSAFASFAHAETPTISSGGSLGAAKKFAEEMVSSGTVAKLRDKYDLKMTVERYMPDNTIPKTDEKFIRK